jgi:hypothetical protein
LAGLVLSSHDHIPLKTTFQKEEDGMDYNLAFSCIGYGSMRAMKERAFFIAPFALPAGWIMTKPDPVQFCVDALREAHPDWAADVDDETRLAIFNRLTLEAERSGLH